MANLNDLNYKSILNMDSDEALELIRQKRVNRREKKAKPATTAKPKTTAKKPIFDMSTLSDEDKKELLALLEED